MKNVLKKAISVLLVTAIVFCSAPLAGFVGLELPEIGGLGKLADSVSEFFAGFAPRAEAATSGTCGDNLTWTFDESTGELVISGTGDMYDWSSQDEVPWYDYRSSIKTVTISDGVTSIGDDAFYNCESLEGVTIGNSVTFIGDSAFYQCTSLTNLTIGNSVTFIGNCAFCNCESLKSITIPDSVTSIDVGAFKNCYNLTSIIIPDSVTTIGDSAFFYCARLKSVTIGNGVTSIDGRAFAYCESLTSVTIPDSVTSIGEYAFAECVYLKNVYYTGTMVQWSDINIDIMNGALVNATKHYLGEKYSVTLNANGGAFADGSNEKIYEFVSGDKLVFEEPQKNGCRFLGWAIAGDNSNTIITLPETMPAENLEFKAVFEGEPYTVTWIIEGFETYETYRVGDAINKSKTFNKKGYTFVGWTPEIPETMPAQNLEFTAVFEVNLYDAVFNANGGTFPDGDLIKRVPTAYNTAISVPQNPVRNGYEFAGWVYNGKNLGTNLGVMNSIEGKVFEALWVSTNTTSYVVEINTMNTSGDYEVYAVRLNATAGETVSADPVIPDGFELNEQKSVLSGTVSEGETLVLKVYLDRKQYSFITIIDNREISVLYYYGAMIVEPEIPVKDGYVFEGWEGEIPAAMPANDITVTAVFKEKTEDKTYAKITIATPEKRTLYYGETITLYANVKNLPEGAKIKWYVEGDGVSIKPSSSGKSCKVTSTSNGNVVIRAMVVDAKGNTVKGSDGKPVADYETIYSEVTLWQIIVNFFRQLFGKSDSASQLFKGIF